MNSDWVNVETVDKVVDDLIENLGAEDKHYLMSMKEKDLISLHFTFGMGIRNHYGLWMDNDLLKADCKKALEEKGHPEPDHPDSMSTIIIERLYNKLKGKET